jgi:hypothetical protein
MVDFVSNFSEGNFSKDIRLKGVFSFLLPFLHPFLRIFLEKNIKAAN